MQDLTSHIGTLPYASELFGIYQPLLGWRSKLTRARYDRGRLTAFDELSRRLLTRSRSHIELSFTSEPDEHHRPLRFTVEGLRPLDLGALPTPRVAPAIDSGVARLLAADIGAEPPPDLKRLITTETMTGYLEQLQHILVDRERLAGHEDIQEYLDEFERSFPENVDRRAVLTGLFDKESRIAGYLIFTAQHAASALPRLFFDLGDGSASTALAKADPLIGFGAGEYDAVLSPIGIMNLYREYFFEFDSFLGSPVSHVWLSPGGTVELVEVSTRKAFTERTAEAMTETVQRTEATITTQDDIADAVKDENSSNAKFGVTNTASYRTPVFQDTATASFSLDLAKASSRETTHKLMRQQSEKVSSEIKRNFKTTFKTSTEVTDTTSKRYVLQNTTNRLVNYELRRKMRKVGVQVQDLGSQLCWHTFVDDAGAGLGLGQLIHIGQPPELSDLQEPDQPVEPVGEPQEISFSIPFRGIGTDDNDQAYTDGGETEITTILGIPEVKDHIEANFPQSVHFTKPGYSLTSVTLDAQGADVKLSARDVTGELESSTGTFTTHLDYAHFHGRDSVPVKATLSWDPGDTLKKAAADAYKKSVEHYTAERHRRFTEAFLKTSRDRVTAASNVVMRPSEDLREEERTVIYLKLVGQLMKVGGSANKHVVSELIRSMFDVDKMLYFVAPEWWIPRLPRSTQGVGSNKLPPEAETTPAATTPKVGRGTLLGESFVATSSLISAEARKYLSDITVAALDKVPPRRAPIPADNLVDWGGRSAAGRDNYYITEDSKPARFGSSLGWLMQLDGDNLRNAFLNSPWVKAVIPIRIGKEEAAMAWLRQAHVEGDDGLSAEYAPDPDDPAELKSTPAHTVTVEEAIRYLIGEVHENDRNGRTPIVNNPADPDDPRNHFAGSMPTEAVFEHGYYPLAGGVRFDSAGTEQAIISQWMETLPTDQIAAVEVEYNPKTLAAKITPQPGLGHDNHPHAPEPAPVPDPHP